MNLEDVLRFMSIATPIVAAGFSSWAIIASQRVIRNSRKDFTPEDQNKQLEIGTNLMTELLRRSDGEVVRLSSIIELLREENAKYRASVDILPSLQSALDEAKRERDKLRKAVLAISERARVVGRLNYVEVIAWATLALDPTVGEDSFEHMLDNALPGDIESTVTPK